MTAIPFSPGDKLFGYGRDSGGEQQDLSVLQQEQALRAWCAEHGLVMTRFFKDEARRGSTLVGRDDLQSMMHEFRRGCEEAGVIVWKYNRFARSVDNAQYYRAEIRTRGYTFYSITDHVPEGPMGRLFEAAIDFKDEQYVLDLSIDVKRGLRDLVSLYGCVPGTPPVGFRREPVEIGLRRDGAPHVAHRWQPDPDMAPQIRAAFAMRADKASIGMIHKQTRILGSINSYRTFFSNPLYIGILQYGDLRLENYCEPIVPRETWDRVQAIQQSFTHRRHLKSQGTDHPRRANSRFLLSGLARCARCDSPLYGHTSLIRKKYRVDSYYCSRAPRRRDCVRRRIPRADFEKAIIARLQDAFLKPELFAMAYDGLVANQSAQMAEQDRQKGELKSQLGQVRRRLHHVVDGIAENGPSPALNARLRDLEAQQSDLLRQLSTLEAAAIEPVPKIFPEQLAQLAKDIPAVFEKADPDLQRFYLRALINHIDVEREDKLLRGMIYFYYPPPDLSPKEQPLETGEYVLLSPPTPGAPCKWTMKKQRHSFNSCWHVSNASRPILIGHTEPAEREAPCCEHLRL